METIERSTTIAAGSDAVWDVLAKFGAIGVWAPNVDHSCLMTEQSEDIGAVRRIQTGRSTLLETVERWEPTTTLAYRITGLPRVIRSLTSTWRLTEADDRTEVVITTEIDTGPKPPQRLIAKVAGKRLAGASDQMLDGLRAAVERARDE